MPYTRRDIRDSLTPIASDNFGEANLNTAFDVKVVQSRRDAGVLYVLNEDDVFTTGLRFPGHRPEALLALGGGTDSKIVTEKGIAVGASVDDLFGVVGLGNIIETCQMPMSALPVEVVGYEWKDTRDADHRAE